MIINIITDAGSWFNQYLPGLKKEIEALGHNLNIVHNPEDLISADIMFALGYYKIIDKKFFSKNKNNIVIHESNLPQGKGWSPLYWQILEGKNEIVFSLFEMSDKVDSGPIYLQETLNLKGNELCEEIRKFQADKKIKLCLDFIKQYPQIILNGKKQIGEESFYLKRTAKDSELDVNKTISEQFDLLRIVDNENYPAFFQMRGKKYKILIKEYDT